MKILPLFFWETAKLVRPAKLEEEGELKGPAVLGGGASLEKKSDNFELSECENVSGSMMGKKKMSTEKFSPALSSHFLFRNFSVSFCGFSLFLFYYKKIRSRAKKKKTRRKSGKSAAVADSGKPFSIFRGAKKYLLCVAMAISLFQQPERQMVSFIAFASFFSASGKRSREVSEE